MMPESNVEDLIAARGYSGSRRGRQVFTSGPSPRVEQGIEILTGKDGRAEKKMATGSLTQEPSSRLMERTSP